MAGSSLCHYHPRPPSHKTNSRQQVLLLQAEGLKFRRRQHKAKNTKSATAQQLQEIKSKHTHRKRALSLKPTETYYSKQSKCNIIQSSSWQYCYLNHTDPCKIHLGAFVDHRLNQLPICNNRNSQLKVDV